MTGNNILSLILTIILYGFIGYLAIAFLIGVFPLLAVILVIILAVSGVVTAVNFFRAGITRAGVKRTFDDFGNRRTRATVVEITESAEDRKDTPDRNG